MKLRSEGDPGKAARTLHKPGVSKKRVRHDLELGCLSPLTPRRMAEPVVLGSVANGEIGSSEIPPLSDDFWKREAMLKKPRKP